MVSVFISLLATACSAGAPRGAATDAQATSPQGNRSLKVLLRTEPVDLTDSLAGRANFVIAMFNSSLVGLNQYVPYALLTSVPELNSDTWKVFTDGRMETTYRIKPGLTWHDGVPFTSADVVFGYQVSAAKIQYGLPFAEQVEYQAIEEVVAPAPDTVVIRWSKIFQNAASPGFRTLGPLPRHILASAAEKAAVDPQALGSHPYWTSEFVGLQLRLVPALQMQRDNELKATYPSWRSNYLLSPDKFHSANNATPENQWRGNNKLGWVNAENDRLVDLWTQALEVNERNHLMTLAYKNISDDLPGLPLYYNYSVIAHSARLRGPVGSTAGTGYYPNLHEWQAMR